MSVCVCVVVGRENTMQWKEHKTRNLEFQIRILVLCVPRLNCTTPGASFHSPDHSFWNLKMEIIIIISTSPHQNTDLRIYEQRLYTYENIIIRTGAASPMLNHSFKNDGVWWDVTCWMEGGLEGSMSRDGRIVGWLQSSRKEWPRPGSGWTSGKMWMIRYDRVHWLESFCRKWNLSLGNWGTRWVLGNKCVEKYVPRRKRSVRNRWKYFLFCFLLILKVIYSERKRKKKSCLPCKRWQAIRLMVCHFKCIWYEWFLSLLTSNYFNFSVCGNSNLKTPKKQTL